MFIDARSIPSGDIIRSDLCIVGAGPAGIAIGREFAGHNFSVVLLEGGDLNFREASQGLYQGVGVGQHYYPLHTCRYRFFGGSTNYWGGWCRLLDAIDFEERDWVPHSGWPFRKDNLETYYRRAQVVCRLGPYEYDAGSWRGEKEGSMLPAHSDNFSDEICQVRATRFGEVYRETLRKAQNVRVLLNANVLEVKMDQYNRTASHLRVATLAGNHFGVSARFVVLAAGGIENARILLASRCTCERGVGNDHDLVGRFFADHLHVPVGILYPSSPQAYRFYQVHKRKGVNFRGVMSLTEHVRRREQLLGFAVTLHNADDPHDVLSLAEMRRSYNSLIFVLKSLARGEYPDRFGQNVANVFSDIGEAMSVSYRRFVKPPVRRMRIGCRAEQTPNPESRISLHDSKDRFGIPRAQLDWRLTERDLFSLQTAQRILARELHRQGVDMFPFSKRGGGGWDEMIAGGAHHMGTTRIHRNSKMGVVDENCRVHGSSNLYIAGASIFPTGGWAPPTLTIVALALRLADHLRELLQ